MADTQKPIINSFNLSENFDFGTITNQQDAGVSEVDLNDAQTGWVVSSPPFAAMIAMLIAGRLSDRLGRKKILLFVIRQDF